MDNHYEQAVKRSGHSMAIIHNTYDEESGESSIDRVEWIEGEDDYALATPVLLESLFPDITFVPGIAFSLAGVSLHVIGWHDQHRAWKIARVADA
jgi:hypothetical protein